MQWDKKELDTQFTQNVYFWTPNSEILAKAPSPSLFDKRFLQARYFCRLKMLLNDVLPDSSIAYRVIELSPTPSHISPR